MKNPNNYGTVVKLSGNRRRPYAVRKTNGFDSRGYPIYIHIGYTSTKEAGLIMLAEYNKQPWDVQTSRLTFTELYALWEKNRLPKLGKSSQKCLKSAHLHCQNLSTLQYSLIKSYQMQECIDSCGHGYSTQAAIKTLFVHLDRYAMELDIISKCYSSLLHTDTIPETKKKPFSETEVACIRNNQTLPGADSILFLLYTGFRITEMLGIKVSDVHTGSNISYITGGIKTAAGRDRIVPIHSSIETILENRLAHSKSGYLFEWKGKKFSESQYRIIWNRIMKELDMQHTPHECRHTFRSRLDSAGANKVCIDRIMGHKSADTGERVYTHKSIEELKANIELIKG